MLPAGVKKLHHKTPNMQDSTIKYDLSSNRVRIVDAFTEIRLVLQRFISFVSYVNCDDFQEQRIKIIYARN